MNTLLATYNQVGVPYQNMTENQENTFLEAYIEDASIVSGQNPMYYELHEANIYNDTVHIQRINLIISGTEQALPEDLKYTKSLLSTIPFYPLLNCTPNLERSVYYYLPEFPFPATETNANKYDVAYWYSANGNNTTLSRKANGSIKTIQTYTYASGASNRLTSVNFNTSPLPSNTQNYNYDATGNLTQEVNGSTTQTDIGYISYNDMPQSITKSSGTSYYRYDASNMRTVKEVSSTDKEYYFEGVVVDQTGAVKSYQTSEGYATPDGTTVDYFYYVKDWQGTNRSVIDATGTPVNAYDHYPYGLRMPNRHFVTDGEGNRYQFTGHQYDEETTFEYHGARYYNRLLGRYMSVDPLASQFFNWSTYNYTMDNPINLVDPTGMAPEDWIKKKGGDQWVWDASVTSAENTPAGYEHGEVGMTYNSTEGEVRLKDKGAWGFVRDEVEPEAVASSPYNTEVDKYSVFDRPVLNTRSPGYTFSNPQAVRDAFGSSKGWQTVANVAHFVSFDMLLMVATEGALSSTRFASAPAKTGGRVFWSGTGTKTVAENFAKTNGMKTLEMTTKGRIMNTVSPYLPSTISNPIWNSLSKSFATGARGEANFFTTTAGPRATSIWTTVEKPILHKMELI